MAMEWGPISWERDLIHKALETLISTIKRDANPYFRHAALELSTTNPGLAHLTPESLKARLMAEIELYQLLNTARDRMNHYKRDSAHYFGALETIIVRAIERPHHSTFTFLQINTHLYLKRKYPFRTKVQELVALLDLPDCIELPELGQLTLD